MSCTRVSEERRAATATFPADLMTVGAHISQDVSTGSTWLERPDTATHLKLQALGENIRYRIDQETASATVGFQLQAGADTLIPCPNAGISLCAEAGGGSVQAQWVR